MKKSTEKITDTSCRNCGHPIAPDHHFCPECGQDLHSHKQPFVHFFLETLENTFHFDTKLVNTVRDLFVKPGRATINFNNDQRARYVPPVRLYVFTSFLFFIVLNLTEKTSIHLPTPEINLATDSLDTSANSSGNLTNADLKYMTSKQELSEQELDSIIRSKGSEPGLMNRALFKLTRSIFAGATETGEFRHKLQKNISISMFFLMPFFATLLKLFFFGSRKYYMEHLIFSLHLHTAFFMILLVSMSIQHFTGADLGVWTALGILIYVLVAIKNVYGNKWTATVFKTFTMMLFYSVFIAVGILISTLFSLI